jgi:hypothetical protein
VIEFSICHWSTDSSRILLLLVWKRPVECTSFRVKVFGEGHVLYFVLAVMLVGETPSARAEALCLSSLTYLAWCYTTTRVFSLLSQNWQWMC